MVAEVWIEHTTSRLWALRATTALLRDMVILDIYSILEWNSRLWASWCSLDYTPQNVNGMMSPYYEWDCSTLGYGMYEYGANEWTRTTDLGVMNPVLSPAELHWQTMDWADYSEKPKLSRVFLRVFWKSGISSKRNEYFFSWRERIFCIFQGFHVFIFVWSSR